MTSRVSLPSSLTGSQSSGSAILSRSGEGITFSGTGGASQRTATVPLSSDAARTINIGGSGQESMSPIAQKSEDGYMFNVGTIIWLIIIPVIIWVILYTLKPHFVTDLVNGERSLNTSKLLLWTIVISIVILVFLYVGYSWYTGSNGY